MNGHAGINTFEATEHLKTILNVGKSDSDSGKLKMASNGSVDDVGNGSLVLHDGYQKIDFCANKDSSHVQVYGNDIDVFSSPLEFGATCSQVMVENMIDYGWEEKYYYGNLISVHISGLYLAYVLKQSNEKPGFVRLLRPRLNLRHLIKDYKREVKDISFAHTVSQVLLGSVDTCGELIVHKITDDGSTIICNLVIRILRPADWTPSEYNRVIWCLYIPDDNDNNDEDSVGEDVSTLLVVTHNEKAEIWNVETIIKVHGHGNLTTDEVNLGVQVINDHKTPIIAAIFSPDGTALSIASLDGGVNFFQVNSPEKDISPRCLHQWTPHENKTLSSLYFLDNYKNHRPDVQFWKFAITGAENNTEIKLWSCESWNCLQTIRIHPNPEDSVVPSLKAEMDLSSKYLFLSDIKRKALLIMLIQQDPVSGTARICSLSEFQLPYPILSLAVSQISSKSRTFNEEKNSDDEEEGEQMCDEGERKYSIKLFWIQTKALQSCTISYQPKIDSPMRSTGSISSLSQDSYVYKDGLSDISLDIRDTSSRSGKDISLPRSLSAIEDPLPALPSHISTYPSCSEVLLTPDDFTSPSHSSLVGTVPKITDPAPRLSDGIEALPVDAGTLQRRKSSQHSGTSSPSREVAEILAPSKVLHLDEIATNTAAITIKDEVEALSNGIENFNLSVSGISRNSQEYHDWPQAPDPTKNYGISSLKESELLGPTHFQVEGDSSNASFEGSAKFLKFSRNVDEILQKVGSLTDVLHDQRCEIQSLQSEIKMLRQDQILNQHNAIEKIVSNKLENVVSQTIVPHYSRLENLITKKSEEERRRTDKEMTSMSGELSASFSTKLETTLKQELSSNVIPQIHRVLDTIGQKIQLDFNQNFSATDASLRDSLSKHLKGKQFMDSIGQTLSTSLQGIVQSSCKEIFQSSVVPSFEKACQHLFQQLNDVFYKGINDYMQTFERCSQKSCTSLEANVGRVKEEVNKLVTEAHQAIQAQNIKTEAQSSDMMKQHEVLLTSIRQVVQEETRKLLREQQTAVLNSRSTTPVPIADPQLQKQHLMQLVRQGNLNDAFQEALSAMDVQLVLFLCESVHCDQVFGPVPCRLQQHVLLSLVNQLSADLNVKTDIKVRYMEEVIGSLESNNPLIRDHIRGVLEILQQRISLFLSRNPTHKLSRCMRRISLAVNSLIK